MECVFMQEVALGSFSLVLGRIVAMHVADAAVIDADRHYVDTARLDLIGRMEGGWYTRTTERFELPNIPLAEWERSRAAAK
jgi:flavin reductase (DIM6/NTAB) family NADH-FMN oxidoreductase RutF